MSLGFIILRHVNSEQTGKLWIECYDSIRKFYPLNKILIVDDFSNYEFIDTTKILSNTLIINSEFKGRGELLPYYYYFHNKLFDRAVIIHDSVFIQQYIDFGKENKFLWSFEHHWDHLYDHNPIIEVLNNKQLVKEVFNNKHEWEGCFGVMSVLSHEFLCIIETHFRLFNIINYIQSREDRMKLERIFAILFTLSNKLHNTETKSLFGNIHIYSNNFGEFGGETYESYKIKQVTNNVNRPIVKVWSGR